MRKTHSYHIGIAILVALAVTALSAGTALSVTWVAATNLSQVESIQETDRVGITAAAGEVAAIWAQSGAGAGVTIAHQEGGSGAWTTTHPGTVIPGQYAWAPAITHSGSEIGAVWAEGQSRGGCANSQRIVGYRMVSGQSPSKKTIMSTVYGPSTAPDIAVNAAGWHMVFAGSATQDECNSSQYNLYYSFRPTASLDWSSPTKVVTYSAVLPDALQGGIWYPSIATVPGSTAIHLVWEQFLRRPESSSIYETGVWLLSGTANGAATWSSPPVRLSPDTQQYAVRPEIVAGAASKLHIVWTHLIGSKTSPVEQHVYYRSLQSATLTVLNAAPIRVNSNFPTLAGSSLTAQGDTVCAAWHGYYGDQGAGREEINVRCSENGGASWQSEINASESSQWLSIFPTISIDPAETLHFAWAEYEIVGSSYEPVAIFYRNNKAGGVFLPIVMRGK